MMSKGLPKRITSRLGAPNECVCFGLGRKMKDKQNDKIELEDKVKELVNEFGVGVGEQHLRLAMLAKQTRDSHKKLQKSVGELQESLDYLRICIKYQLFDLEATRRENKYLRKLLDEKNR